MPFAGAAVQELQVLSHRKHPGPYCCTLFPWSQFVMAGDGGASASQAVSQPYSQSTLAKATGKHFEKVISQKSVIREHLQTDLQLCHDHKAMHLAQRDLQTHSSAEINTLKPQPATL